MAYLFIVFEGIDGAGKGTQIKFLEKELKKRKEKVFLYKYPTKKAKKIKEYLNQKIDLTEDEAFFEYLKDIGSQQNKIKESLEKGWVICDRYFFSTLAYQSIEQPLENRMEMLKNFKLTEPDFVVWLDIQPKNALERKLKNKLPDRFEQDLKKLELIRKNYQKLYALSFMSKKWLKINSAQSSKKIFEIIKKEIIKE
ncbi:MAG: dTMP kinase [Candidatus Anstonellaceae archaeon]